MTFNLMKINFRTFSQSKKLPKFLKEKMDYSQQEYEEIRSNIYNMENQSDMINFMDKFGDNLNDEFLYEYLSKIIHHRMELDSDFDDAVGPILCHYISLMNRENSMYFGLILKDLSFIEL